MSRLNDGPFWAGGSPPGWFVKMDRAQDVYPGTKPPDVMVKFFPSGNYSNGETGAAHAADELAKQLNITMGRYA